MILDLTETGVDTVGVDYLDTYETKASIEKVDWQDSMGRNTAKRFSEEITLFPMYGCQIFMIDYI